MTIEDYILRELARWAALELWAQIFAPGQTVAQIMGDNPWLCRGRVRILTCRRENE